MGVSIRFHSETLDCGYFGFKKLRDSILKHVPHKKLHEVYDDVQNHLFIFDADENKRCLALADYAEAESCYHATLANGFWLLRNDLKKRDDERRIAKRWDKSKSLVSHRREIQTKLNRPVGQRKQNEKVEPNTRIVSAVRG